MVVYHTIMLITHAFNIDWRLSEDKDRPIQLNLADIRL